MASGPEQAESSRPEAALPRRGWISASWVDLALVVLVLASLLLPIASVGMWDPFELNVAEAARRIAVNLLGAHHLSLDGALNDVPIRRELGRGELPFTSIALGLRLFGLSDWAARLPLVLWGLLGVLATYSLVDAFADRRAARLAAALLAVTPLYFLNVRTLSGDVVTMAAAALALRGLAGAMLGGRGAMRGGTRTRALWLLVGVLGLYAGFWTRGLLIGVVVPTLGASLGLLVVSAPTQGKNLLAWFLLGGGTLAAFIGAWGLLAGETGRYSILLGARVVAPGDAAAHDSVLQFLAHGAFPLSAFLPFAVARLLHPPAQSLARSDELALRAMVMGCLVVGFAVHGFVAPYTGPLPFVATGACAAAVALLLRDLGSERVPSRALGMSVVALAVLLLLDFDEHPDEAFSPFVSASAVFPSNLLSLHRLTWFGVAASCSFVFLFVIGDRRPPSAPRFAWQKDYLPYLKALRSAYGGNLWFVLVVLCGGFTSWAALIWLSDTYLRIPAISNVWSVIRTLAYNAWWVFPVAVFAMPLVVIAVADVFRSLQRPGFGWLTHPWLRRLQFTPTTLCAGTLLAGGLFLSLDYYPKLMNQLSPKQVFVRYERVAQSGQPLGLLRLGGSAADYYTRGSAVAFESVHAAFDWLNVSGERRFLMLRASDLPELNAMFRRQRTPARNLPIVDASSSEILLASNRLEKGEHNQNPFDAWILTERPAPAHVLDANLGNELDVLGWELRDRAGDVVRAIKTSVPYELVIFYEVRAPINADWETFVHIDGYRRRYNGDHETLEGKYPLSLLRRGDFVRDVHVIELDPNFTPGTYRLYFGLFRGSRRLEVRRGKNDDDRIRAGRILVR